MDKHEKLGANHWYFLMINFRSRKHRPDLGTVTMVSHWFLKSTTPVVLCFLGGADKSVSFFFSFLLRGVSYIHVLFISYVHLKGTIC